MKEALLVAAVSLIATGCRHGWCRDEVKQEVRSSGEQYVARVVEWNCGAMTSYATVVELRKRGSLFSSTQEVFWVTNPHALKIEWQGANLVRIQCPDCSKRDIRGVPLSQAFGVNIEYRLPNGDAGS